MKDRNFSSRNGDFEVFKSSILQDQDISLYDYVKGFITIIVIFIFIVIVISFLDYIYINIYHNQPQNLVRPKIHRGCVKYQSIKCATRSDGAMCVQMANDRVTIFHSRPVLAFGYWHRLRVCVCQSVCQPLACPRDNSGPVQARIAKSYMHTDSVPPWTVKQSSYKSLWDHRSPASPRQ